MTRALPKTRMEEPCMGALYPIRLDGPLGARTDPVPCYGRRSSEPGKRARGPRPQGIRHAGSYEEDDYARDHFQQDHCPGDTGRHRIR
ncbi:MAG: hypothetical protein OXU61_09245 [Gammaproteobacteria bacterium]|nr:hypothetical protein [Gammaproteobacteria bacterium]